MGSNLAIKPGSEVDYGERRFVIMQVISFEAVVARDVETGELERLPISGLQPILSAAPSALPPDLSVLDDRDWAEARRRLDLIGPVLEKARLPRSVMAARARGRRRGDDALSLGARISHHRTALVAAPL